MFVKRFVYSTLKYVYEALKNHSCCMCFRSVSCGRTFLTNSRGDGFYIFRQVPYPDDMMLVRNRIYRIVTQYRRSSFKDLRSRFSQLFVSSDFCQFWKLTLAVAQADPNWPPRKP